MKTFSVFCGITGLLSGIILLFSDNLWGLGIFFVVINITILSIIALRK